MPTYIILLLINIFFQLIVSLYSCNFFESKKLCDCGFFYSVGLNEPKKLFDLASLEDCGINLTCNDSDCAERCLNFVRKTLGCYFFYLFKRIYI